MNKYIKEIFNIKRWYNSFNECQGVVLKTLFILWFILYYTIISSVFYVFFILSPLNFNSESIVFKTISILTFSTGLGGILYEPFAKLIDKLVENGRIGVKIADWLKNIPVIPIYIYSTLFVLYFLYYFLTGQVPIPLNNSYLFR